MILAAIALSVFRESVRDKVFYNLLLFAVLLVAASFLIGQLTAGQDLKIIKDLGLAATSLFGLFISVFVGIGLLWKEVDQRSVYNVLSKPVRRHQLVLGKYLGLLLTLLVNVAVMGLVLYGLLAYMNSTLPPNLKAAVEAPPLDPRLLLALFLIFVQLAMVTAVALFFSTFASPMVSAALTFGLYVVGHFNADLKNFELIVPSKAVGWLARSLYYLLPNLAPLDVKAQVVHGQAIAGGYVELGVVYAVVYIAALLLGACVIFSRRDLK
jgi:ABC-type transport system involved in multi-copper enzyme maturation permease subunit